MKIELLYSDDCAHWEATLEDLRELLGSNGVEDEVSVIRVSSMEEAERLRFPGSPTVRIDDEDVDPDTPESDFDLACRLYEVDEGYQERPPREWIDAAIEAASG